MCSITETRRKNKSLKHGNNLKGDDSETNYRVTNVAPFVERILSQMEARFAYHNKKALSFGFILPKL